MGTPSSIARIAGARLSASPSLPQRSDMVQKASTAPGTVTAWALSSGTVSWPSARRVAALAPAGARPDPLTAITSSPPAGETSAKQSPPIPVMAGSASPSRTAPAMAASIAFPPCRRIEIAASAASGCEVAQRPFIARTGDRPGSWKSRMSGVSSLVSGSISAGSGASIACLSGGDVRAGLCSRDRAPGQSLYRDRARDRRQSGPTFEWADFSVT